MIIATFGHQASLADAVHRCQAARIGPIETFTPAPLQDQSTASPIPLIILLAGIAGALLSFLLQSYSAGSAYRFNIGGRPPISWPSFIPTTFENGALVAVVAGFIAFLAVNRLPRLYHPVDEAAGIRRASQDRWVLQVATGDDAMLERARVMLRELSPLQLEELPG